MRKLQTISAREKSRKIKSTILTFILLGLLILSTVGFAFMSFSKEDSGNTNKDYFEIPGGGWGTTYQDQVFQFNTPRDSYSNVSIISGITVNNYYSQEIYIDSTNQAVYNELQSVLNRFAARIQPACYLECDLDLPEKNCSSYLIVWKDSQENKVYQKENCIFIEGDLRAVDAFLVNILGI